MTVEASKSVIAWKGCRIRFRSRFSMLLVGISAAFCNLPDAFAEDSSVVATDAKDKLKEATPEIDYKKISDAEWKKKLTKTQFNVTRKHDTEPPFTGKYHASKKDGLYTCVCCGQPLFDSKSKFDSGTGWPSFFQPVKESQIGKSQDNKLGYLRVEIHCSRCDAHLGHVFNDAPQTPTGLRYCMNSASLNFVDRKAADKLLLKLDQQDSAESQEPSTTRE